MNDSIYIDKNRSLKESEDYNFLREKGIEYIQKLGSNIWTDYNVHDPGINILEVLCYAITDIAYRTEYPIEDILAEGVKANNKNEKNFFSAKEILTCNPVTFNDYRKLLIDVKGIKNAWLKIVDKPEPQIFINCSDSKLTTETSAQKIKNVNFQGLYDVILELEEDEQLGDLNKYCFEKNITGDVPFSFRIVLPGWGAFYEEHEKLSNIKFGSISSIDKTQNYKAVLKCKFENGTVKSYQVIIHSEGKKTAENKEKIAAELKRTDDLSLASLYQSMINKALSIVSEAYITLHKHRNLCEDIYKFKTVELEEICLCADIEVSSDADINEVLAQIYYKAANFLAPPITFYTIKEMMDKGKTSENIFEGPSLKHGFIDDDELAASEFKEVIHTSDIIQIIMDIEGVTAVKNLLLTNYYKCEPVIEGEAWCLKIGKNRATRLCKNRSKIVFYKGMIPYSADKRETDNNLKDLKALDRTQRLAEEDYDLPIPKGKSRSINDYHSIQNHFPLCYGIGVEGLPISAEEQRKAQAKQLKAFLLLFDQILADYLAQLAHVRDLFSLNPEIKKTYFSHPLYAMPEGVTTEIPNIQNLLKEFVDTLDLTNPNIDLDDKSTYETEWQNYKTQIVDDYNSNPHKIEEQLEDKYTNEDRKNRLLDHLMGRFAEQLTDYVLLMYTLDRKKAPAELITDKLSFLNDYPEISRNRGKAFNYKDPNEVWDTKNVSGLQKRTARLLGINSYTRRTLNDCIIKAFDIYQEKDENNVDVFRFRLTDKDGNILLSSPTYYLNKKDVLAEIENVIRCAKEKDFFEIKKNTNGKYYFNLINEAGKIIARRIGFFNTEGDLLNAIEKIINSINKIEANCEGFHLIEHILLRPKTANDIIMKVCVNKDCKNCPGFIDPYSFRVTAVVPYWPERFRNLDFRTHFESTLRLEAPAHVHVKICWVNQEAMQLFEDAYIPWLKEISKEKPEQANLTLLQNNLLTVLESLRSVYPETRLYDCNDESADNTIILNHSILGSTKEEDNGNV